jgi:hypothetical protein
VQWVKVTAETEPAPEPDSPLPLFSVPLAVTDEQVKVDPVVVSLKLAFPAVAVNAPPG